MATERRARTERNLVFALGAVLVFLAGLYLLLQRAHRLSPQLLASSLFLFALAMVNVVLILVLLFVLFRNLIKLLVERRRGVLGSRFRTKMVFTFAAMTLLPSMVLFAAALYLIQLSVERWFSTPVDEITRLSQEIVDPFHSSVKEGVRADAEDLAAAIRAGRLLDLDRAPALRAEMLAAIPVRHLDRIEVRTRTDPPLDVGAEPEAPTHAGAIPEGLLQGAFAGTSFEWMERMDRGFLVRAGAPIHSTFNQDVVGVVIAGVRIAEDLTAKTARVVMANENYRQLKAGKIDVKRVYEFTFTLVGLLIVFAATWVGLFLARGFTAPVQALAEGTRAIAAGNLDHRIVVEAHDEMGILVASFNRMTEELKHGHDEIERSNLELQRTNLEIEERRGYIVTLLENLTTGVASLDPKGRISTMNRAAYRILRLESAQDVTGMPYSELLGREGFEPLREFLDRAREEAGVRVTREFHFGTGGRNFSLAVTVSSLADPRRGTVGLLVVLEDLTHLIRAQKIAAWREVARRMAHEIKNPLTPIQLSAQRIAKKVADRSPDLDEVVRTGTATIIAEVNALKALVNEFSRYARMPEVQAVAADVHGVLDSALALYEGVHGEVKFTRHYGSSVPWLPLDREQMKRVFINLLDNAIEAMGRRGEVSLRTEHLPHLGLVRVEVADDGPGIPPDDREKLFLPYFSTKKRGTGLGLAIVNRIVADHHGGIRVEDNTPRGARFVIDLPAEAA